MSLTQQEKEKLIEGYFRYVSEKIAKDEEYNNWDYWLKVIEERDKMFIEEFGDFNDGCSCCANTTVGEEMKKNI